MSDPDDESQEEIAALRQKIDRLQAALEQLIEACEYVKPFAGAVAVKASVKDIRKAGSFVKAVETARRALEGTNND